MYIFDDGFYTKREILDVIKKKKRISQQILERIFKRLKKQIFLKADNGKYVYLPAYIDRFFEKTQSRTNTSPYFHVREKVLENDENEIRRAIAEMMEEDRIIERQDELRVKGYLQDDEIRRLARNKRYVENLSLSSLLEKIFLKDTITIRYDWLAKPKENKSQN